MDADIIDIKDANDTNDIYRLIEEFKLNKQIIIDSGPIGYTTILNFENLHILINSSK